MAVDPSSSSIEIRIPQTWNRYTYALNNPLRFVDPDGRKYKGKMAEKALEDCRKNCNEKQKEDAETVESNTDLEVDMGESGDAVFVEKDAEDREIDRSVHNPGTATGKKAADQKAEEARKPGSTIEPRTGETLNNPDGTKTIIVYYGSKQYSQQDQGKSRAEYRRTVFAHESAEINGRSHKDATEREKSP